MSFVLLGCFGFPNPTESKLKKDYYLCGGLVGGERESELRGKFDTCVFNVDFVLNNSGSEVTKYWS